MNLGAEESIHIPTYKVSTHLVFTVSTDLVKALRIGLQAFSLIIAVRTAVASTVENYRSRCNIGMSLDMI